MTTAADWREAARLALETCAIRLDVRIDVAKPENGSVTIGVGFAVEITSAMRRAAEMLAASPSDLGRRVLALESVAHPPIDLGEVIDAAGLTAQMKRIADALEIKAMTTTDTLRARLQDKPGVMGATITLYGGGYFDFIEPERSVFRIEDIARGLSNTCRFGGQANYGDGFYSVAQHSVLVSHMVEREHAYAALMHDAAEAYIGDMVGPLKQLCPDFKAIEKRVEVALFAWAGIALPLHPSIKHADLRALRTEQRDLTSGAGDNWSGLDAFEPDGERILPRRPADACALFLARFIEVWPS